jgi:transposase-like protein
MHTMTKKQGKSGTIDVKALLAEDEEFLRALVRMALQEVLEAEMTEALGAEKGERTAGRQGYRSGYYGRTLITRVGKLELRVPQDRTGRFSTELFERYQRSERALVAALAEMYVQGVSTRKVKAITEELCGHSFSASSISAMNQRLDASLAQFAGRPLAEAFPYLILDARYERVREAGVIASQAVLIAIGVDWDGRRQVLAVELANRESRSSWRDFLLGLKARGLHGVEFVVADDHAGLRAALREVVAEAAYQRCYVHFLRNALDYVPRRVDDDCLQELRWLYDRRDLPEARRDLAAWLAKWSGKYSKLTGWVEENIDETLTFYRLPRQHHKHLKSTNMLERLNEEIRRRTHVVRIFPMAKVACDSYGRSPSRPTRTGSSSIATSTWTICASTRRRHCDVRPDHRPVQPSTVLALSRTLRAGCAGATTFAAASLTAAARGALPDGRSGRRDGPSPIEQRDVLLT